MKKNKTFGNLKITTSLPHFSTVLENSTIKTSAVKPMLKQWLKEKVGVLFFFIILHLFDLLVQVFYLLVELNELTYKKELSGLALVGGAA